MTNPDPPFAAPEKIARLARLRRVAAGVLAALAAIYGATFFLEPAPWVEFVRRVTEAGMIGGLADWFAVSALFRRPLGLPIPHTALLPRNQKRVAANVGRFVQEYIMEPRKIGQRLRERALTEQGVDWLLSEGAAERAGRFLARRIEGLAKMDLPPSLVVALTEAARKALQSPAAAESLSRAVAEAVRGPASEKLLDSALGLLREAIENNRAAAVKLVVDNSRWWTPKAVDRYVAGVVVDGALKAIDSMADPDSRIRAEFRAAAGRLADRMHEDGAPSPAVRAGLARLSESDAVEAVVSAVVAALRKEIKDEAASGRMAARIAAALRETAADLKADPAAMRRLDRRAAVALTAMAVEARPVIGDFIRDTLAAWDSDTLIRRFELEVGPDLQFIRINGAVLGAALGACFYGLSLLAL